METCFSYTSDTMYVSTDEKWLINRILKFAQNNKEDVSIIALPQENTGCLYCTVPSSWVKLTPPTKRNMTDEQKEAAIMRLKKAREEKARGNNSE